MIKILIVDDHTVVREGLKGIISETSVMVVADKASTGQEALEEVRKKKYDMVVLDISMPDRSGQMKISVYNTSEIKIRHSIFVIQYS